MKRSLLFVCCTFCFLLLVGCGNTKTLKCSLKDSIGDASSLSQDYIIKFKNDAISNVSLDFDVTFNDLDEESSNSLETSVDNTFGMYKDLSGSNYSAKVRDNGFNVRIKLNFNKMSKADKKKVTLLNYEGNYEQTKKELEKNGFICK